MRQDPVSARGKILLGLLAVGLGGTSGALGVLPLPLQVTNRLAEARSRVPITWGVPLALGDGVSDPGQLTLLRGGETVPVQLLPLARWGGAPGDPGRPIAWLLADLQLDLAPGETAYLTLVAVPRTDPPSPLRVAEDDASGMVIETGAATYSLSRTAFRLFDSVILAGGPTFSGGGGLRYQGNYLTGPATMAVEQQGPERLSILVRGTLVTDLEFTLRLHFFR